MVTHRTTSPSNATVEPERAMKDGPRFEDFFHLSADIFWELDEHLRYTYLSREFLNQDPSETAELLGKTPWQAVQGLHNAVWNEMIADMKAHKPLNDVVITLPVGIRHKSYSIRARPMFDKDGSFVGYRGAATDITPYIRAKDSIAAVSEGLQGVVGSVFFAALVKSLANLLAMNIVFVGELNKDQDRIRTIAVHMDGEEGDNFEYILKDTPCENVVGRTPCYYERDVAQLFPDDEMLEQMGIVSYAGIPLFDPQEKPLGIIVVLRRSELENADEVTRYLQLFSARTEAEMVRLRAEDIILSAKDELEAQVKERTRDLQAAKNLAEEASKAKSLFLSSMSHELRTPLNAVIGYSEFLEYHPEFGLVGKQKEYVSTITNAGRHLLALINDLLDLTKIDAGQFELDIQNIKIDTVIADSLPLVQPMADERGVLITVLSDGDDLIVPADPTRIEQILVNLLSNAIKYNRPEGHVTVSVESQGGRLELSVSDTGLGIPESLQERLFVPFERLGREALAVEGSGIGLSISRTFANLMGGDILVSSTEGKGSRFTVTLPLST